jgi:GT2 family glycosyltransferase
MEIIVVDNASKDGSAEAIASAFPEVTLIQNSENAGFGRANNQAVEHATGRYLLLLNSDAFVGRETLRRTLEFMDREPECGILGVKLVGTDGALQPSARNFPTPLNIFTNATGTHRFLPWVQPIDDPNLDFDAMRECDWVPGAYFLIRKAVIGARELFDPRFFMYYEEVDLCFAAKKRGWRVFFWPDAKVVHIGGHSAAAEAVITADGRQIERLRLESELLYFRKNYGLRTVLSDLLLLSLTDFMYIAKKAVVWRKPTSIKGRLQHMLLTWSIFVQTHLATRATR